MTCSDPRHADCPNCDGEVLVGKFSPINITTLDKATGAYDVREVVQLPRHVLDLACPRPLVTFQELVARAKAGDREALHNLRGHRAKDVAAALGSAFLVKPRTDAPEMVDLIQAPESLGG